MSTTDPYNVDVFHFANRISSAKLRKYKIATEKGMGPSGLSGRTPTPTPGPSNSKASPSPEDDASTTERPAKRPRLKLNLRNRSQGRQSHSPDTIAVSQPARHTSTKASDMDDMEVEILQVNGVPEKRNERAPSAESSELSSLSSVSPPTQQATPARETRPVSKSSKARDYSRDFMSYYVDGGDEGEDDEEVEEAPPKPTPKLPVKPVQQPAPKPAPVAQPPSTNEQHPHFAQQPPRETRFKNHMGPPPPYPTSARERAVVSRPKGPPPRPQLIIIDNIRPTNGPPQPRALDTVAAIIQKLEALSAVLVRFNAPLPASLAIDFQSAQNPPPRSMGAHNNGPAQPHAAADNLLALFGDEDDSDGKASPTKDPQETPEAKEPPQDPLQQLLETFGSRDQILSFGFQFIQQALLSWAQQRLHMHYEYYYYQTHQWAEQQARKPKRGPGRPRKFDDEEELLLDNLPPQIKHENLDATDEGAVIKAFQDVLESGCLQVNAVIPAELGRALHRVYYQIDQLINKGAVPPQSNWRCMSYGAQIAANRVRVEEWKEARARTQADMERHQLDVQRRSMQQWNTEAQVIPANQQQFHQMQQNGLERTRGPPQNGYHPRALGTPNNTIPLSDNEPQVGVQTNSTVSHAGSQTKGNGSKQLDQAKLQMPTYLPRSGQTMKFSFASSNELAVKTLGSNAFPSKRDAAGLPGSRTNSTGPNAGVPSSSPPMPDRPPSPATARATAAALVASATNKQSHRLNSFGREDDSDTIQVAAKPSARRTSKSASEEYRPRSSTSNGRAALKPDEAQRSSENGPVRQSDRTRSATKSKATSVDITSDANAKTNGTTASASPTLG